MYHKFASRKLPGGSDLYMTVILLALVIVPDMGIAAGNSRQLAAPAGGHPAALQAQETDEQVRLARGVFLIAKKSMPDPNFAGTVLLITEYEESGTVGLVLNRPLDKPAHEILPELEGLDPGSSQLFLGGPVRLNSLRILVQTDADLGDYHSVVGDVFQIDDLQGVRNLLNRELGQFRIRLYAGYAGWYPGQLEREMLRGDWLLSRADTSLIFTDDPASLWEKLLGEEDMQWVRLNNESPAATEYSTGCRVKPGMTSGFYIKVSYK
ncbi:MAG: YqgE/AlgH family protein [Gammaproteobacteria bacterium]|nr:YqgE/AlgH family protein [Gammaproteobacteria bacterium]